jgi:rod shape-determining protein MreD
MAQKKESFIRSKFFLLFFISIFSMIVFSSLLEIKFIFFAPLIIFLFYRTSIISILWISAILGLIQDLLSSNFFGFNTLCYTLTTMTLYKGKRFFNEKPVNLSIFTAVYSIIFSIFSPILFFIFDKKINLSIKCLGTDLIMYPILDGIYAFLFFSIPIIILEKITKYGFKNLWLTCQKMIFRTSR